MAKYSTRKATASGKSQTLALRTARARKYSATAPMLTRSAHVRSTANNLKVR